MIFVEHSLPGYKWADSFQGNGFDITVAGPDLQIVGKVPTFPSEESDYELVTQLNRFSKQFSVAREGTETTSPGTEFANALSDKELVAFVKKYGPVVATQVEERSQLTYNVSAIETDQEKRYLFAAQNMQELRDEQIIYRAALRLMEHLKTGNPNNQIKIDLMTIIAEKIENWPNQWQRERSARSQDPFWRLMPGAVENIRTMADLRKTRKRDAFLDGGALDGWILLSELLNSFRPMVFPNAIRLNHYFRYGMRPLLYSILRHHLSFPQDVAICRNPKCFKFFNVTRAERIYCDPICSRQHRQRNYWQETGAALRAKRTAKESDRRPAGKFKKGRSSAAK